MNKNFRIILWGLILIFFRVRILSVDILPNFIGYILIWQGLYKMKQHDIEFGKGIIYAQVMVAISILQGSMLWFGIDSSSIIMANMWVIVLEQLGVIIMLVIIYYICKGSYNLEENRMNAQLYNKIKFRWKFYFNSTVAIIIITAFTLNYLGTVMILPIILIVNVFSKVLILFMVRKEGKEFVTLVE